MGVDLIVWAILDKLRLRIIWLMTIGASSFLLFAYFQSVILNLFMNITYRRVELNNEKEMREIASIDATIPPLFDGKFKVNEESIEGYYQQLMKCTSQDFFDVVVNEGKIIGFHFMYQFKSSHGLMAAHVHTIWVHPDFRKRGIAKTLKDRGERWAKEHRLDHISTFVHGKNSAMLDLNEELGYELVGYKLRKPL